MPFTSLDTEEKLIERCKNSKALELILSAPTNLKMVSVAQANACRTFT